MGKQLKDNYLLFNQPELLYEAMLNDIFASQHYIYLEVYKWGDDSIGDKFRDALTQMSRKGVKIRLLIDSWGAQVSSTYFSEMIQHGAEVRFFRKIIFSFNLFTRNHRRNHRKLMIIDDHIAYIGSANIAGHSLKWRELHMRATGGIALVLKKTFLDSFKNYNRYIQNTYSFKKTLQYGSFEIVQDMPTIYRQLVKRKYETLIKRARNSIVIETPYFLPGFKLRKALFNAARRGVDVKIIMPLHSDIRTVDMLRDKYLGKFHLKNVKLFFYKPTNLHSKCFLMDDRIFALGTSNFDYRSFRYCHEIMLFGTEPLVVDQLKAHMDETLQECQPFNHEAWLARPLSEKIIGWLLVPFRHLF
ncbi:MAG TPA: phospholipase D-like domain-containing protein [Bacteroidales bacterium]|nr:phospholipase D-like domain-containing protein [Bacteroidales bacterium]